jgi:hypothetical protein
VPSFSSVSDALTSFASRICTESTADRPGGSLLQAATQRSKGAKRKRSKEEVFGEAGIGEAVPFMLPLPGVSRNVIRLLSALSFSACAGSVPHPPYSPQATTALAPLEVAPPPGRVESIPPRPPRADAWVDGEWILRRGRWYWLLGRWVKVPPGATFSPWTAVRSSDGVVWYAEGGWRDARGTPIEAPAPLSVATASNVAIVDPEGHTEDTGPDIQNAPPAHHQAPKAQH